MLNRRSALAAVVLGAPLAPAWGQVLMQISTLPDPDPAAIIAERILREAYRRIGRELEVKAMPGERSLLSANSGDTDGELYRRAGIDKAYPNLLMVPVALQQYEIVVFSKLRQFDVRGWESLRPYKLGFVKAHFALPMDDAMCRRPERARTRAARQQG